MTSLIWSQCNITCIFMTRDASENFHICQPSLLLLILLIFVKIVFAIEIFLHKVYNITSAKRSPVRYPPKLQPQTQTFEASTYESIFRNSLKVKVKFWFTYIRNVKVKSSKNWKVKFICINSLNLKMIMLTSENLESRIIMKSIQPQMRTSFSTRWKWNWPHTW